jgi:two-component system, sensor histidine kinase
MGLKVLLVEDDELFRHAMTRFLENLGHEVIWAQDARRAIHYLKTEDEIGLVILDMTLAGETTGWSVAEFRYHDPYAKKIPLVVMSGTDPAQILSRARENWLEGVGLMLEKPPNIAQLQKYLASLGGESIASFPPETGETD